MSHLRTASDMLPGEGPVERWTPARKAEVLRRIQRGELTAGEALNRWRISVEELDAWVQAHRRGGREALKATTPPAQGRLL